MGFIIQFIAESFIEFLVWLGFEAFVDKKKARANTRDALKGKRNSR